MTAALLLVWVSIIVYASSQPYSEQDLRPILRGYNVDWAESWFGWVSFTYAESEISVKERGAEGFVEFFIRKGAHLSVFAILGFLTLRLLSVTRLYWFWRVVLALSIVILFASIDEYRHFLHPGRTGLIEDVKLDSLGGLIGISFYLLISSWKHRRKKHSKVQ